MPKIDLINVNKIFLGKTGVVHALNNVNLTIEDGEFLCIVGPSGCGKSTFLNVVAGLTNVDDGEVLIDDMPIKGPGTDRVLIFQEPALFPWLNVIQNVAFGLRMAGLLKEESYERARALLRIVKLSKFEKSWIHELSGGMKQRVALARALALDPNVLLMDEPFAALDAQTRDMLHEELEILWLETGKTIIFVTHNVREAVRLGSRVILMTARDGKIKREYKIDLPRPRHIEDNELIDIARIIRDDLKEEVLKVSEEVI
ncbi:MAG: ABC transporter ATP-binding protein [Proteobacteria bacterium]|nr:ABC transporter ATP-binding protein [Pseudomonadota bacterium]